MANARRPIGAKDAGTTEPAQNDKAPKAADETPAVDPAAPAAPAPAEEPAPSPDTVDPVDTESPDYKAGYQNGVDKIDTGSADYKAGYAAGLGSSGSATAEGDKADPAPPDEPAAAKVNDLLALCGGDKALAMDFLTDGLSLAAAKDKLIAHQREQIKTLSARTEKAERDLETEQGSPAPARLPAKAQVDAPPAPESIEDPEARAKAEWGAMDADARAGFISEAVFVAARKRELAAAGR